MSSTMPSNPDSSIPPDGIDLGPGRRRVMRQDFVVYHALVGGEGRAGDRQPASSAAARTDQPVGGRPRKGWFPRVSKVLALQLADCYQGVYLRLGEPEFPAWVRRASRDARRKMHAAQIRLRLARPVHRG